MKKLRWPIIATCLVMIQSLQAQYIVKSCENFGFTSAMVDHDGKSSTGVDGKEYDLLRLYKSDGSSLPDCWVFKGRNDLDYVIAPGYWTDTPDGPEMELIDAAFEAMIKSRGKFSAYGHTAKKWYFFMEGRTPDEDAQAYDYKRNCFMRSIAWREGGTLDHFKQTVAHEAGHCFAIENLEDPLYHYYKKWLDESFAEFMSTLVYPEVNLEHRFARKFDLDETVFPQAYNAYVLLEYYAKAKISVEDAINLVKTLYKVPWEEDKYYLNSIGFAQHLHDFYFQYYQKELFDPGGGKVPREPTVKLRSPSITFQPDGEPIELSAIPPDMLSVFELVIPAGYDLEILIPKERGLQGNYSIIGIMEDIPNWSETQNIQGNCEKDTPMKLLVSHMNNRPLTGVTIPYELSERSGCCGSTTTVSVNPSDDVLDGQYTFDYYVESDIEFVSDDQVETISLNYFVNSKDGSMLLQDGFFMENFGTMESGGMEAEAVIWRSNGQPVGFVIDHVHGQRRAITIDVNQTASDVMGPRAVNPGELLREGTRSGLPLMELSWDNPWLGKAEGYVYNRQERYTPAETFLMTAYVTRETTSVNSPMDSFGFMVGHIKDLTGKNKQLVFTRFDFDGGDSIEARLKRLEKRCAEFNAFGYKKMTIGSSTGAIAAMTVAEREAFADSQNEMQAELMMMLKDLENCRGDARCEAEVQKRMMELERQMQDAIFDLPENSENRGNAASEFQEDQRAIRDDMHQLQETILDQEVKCDRLRRLGGARLAVESCETQLEVYKNRMHQLNCKLARLQGVSDMFEDCPQ